MEDDKIQVIAHMWLEAYRSDSELLSDKKAIKISNYLNLIFDGPEVDFWTFFDEIVRGTETEFQVANFGCGPLETYLNTRPVRIDFVAERVARGGLNVEMLALVDYEDVRDSALKSLLRSLIGERTRGRDL